MTGHLLPPDTSQRPLTLTRVPQSITLCKTENSNVFVLKIDTAGNFIWAKTLGGSVFGGAFSLALDNSANVCITVIFRDSGDFDPAPSVCKLRSVGNNDIFIAKLNTAGSFVWAGSIGTTADLATSIALEAAQNIYTTGLVCRHLRL